MKNTTIKAGQPSVANAETAIDNALDRLAERVKDNIGAFGLNGGRPGKVMGLAEKVLSSNTTSEKRTASDELAAQLKQGSEAGKKKASEFTDQLQAKLQLEGKAISPPAKGSNIPGSVPPVKTAKGAVPPGASKPAGSPAPEQGDGEEGDSDETGEEGESGEQEAEQEGQNDAEQENQDPSDESPYAEADLRLVKIEDIQTSDPFKSLFPALADKVAKLTADMKARGYDQAHPVVIWEEKNILLDGHCRVRAAGDAGIDTIPAVFQSFGTEEAAFLYAVRTQCARRNLTDGDIVSLVQQIDKRYPRGGNKRGRPKKDSNAPSGAFGRSSKETGEKIGYSYRTVERARKLIDSKNASILQEVVNGTLSLGEALKRLPKGHRNVDPEVAAARARIKVRRLLESAKGVMGNNEDLFSDMMNKLDELLNELESE